LHFTDSAALTQTVFPFFPNKQNKNLRTTTPHLSDISLLPNSTKQHLQQPSTTMPSTLLNTDKQTNGAILNKAEETNATAIPDQQAAGESIEETISPNNEARVFFFDIDNCLYPKDSGIPDLMREK
jgi:hypothetical protein